MQKDQFFTILAAFIVITCLVSSCASQENTTPTTIPTNSQNPTPTQNQTAEPTELVTEPFVETYKNGFEGEFNLTVSGITSPGNSLVLNTENVAFQSGLQSLEVHGTLQGAMFSSLSFFFSVPELTQATTLDLSKKVIDFSYFIPQTAPFSSLIFSARSGEKEVNLFRIDITDQNRGSWQYRQTNIQSIFDQNAWEFTTLSNEEARMVVQNCDTFVISGMRTSEGEEVETGFLIDDLKWIEIGDPATFMVDPSLPSLRQLASEKQINLSTTILYDGVNNWYEDPWYLYTVAREFNTTAVGGGPAPDEKPADISTIQFDYTNGDKLLEFAEGHGMTLYAGTGGWHSGNPRWITDGTYDDLKAYLDRKIESDMTHFAGKVKYWFVFNEIVNQTSFRNRQAKDPNDILYGTDYAPYGGTYSPYVDGNDISLIEFALTKAKSMDDQALVFLNDYEQERLGEPKAEFYYNFIMDLQNRNIPIDGVGFQMHLMYPNRPGPSNQGTLPDADEYFEKIDQNVKRYADAGIKIAITEFELQIRLDDIDLSSPEGKAEYQRRVEAQSQYYARLIQLAMDNPNVVFINIWSAADKPQTSAFDWNTMEVGSDILLFSDTDAFLFDKNYDPKPAYEAVRSMLLSRDG